MAHINQNFLKLPGGYLFPEIGRRVRAFSAEEPPKPLIRLGIGDVTQPIAPSLSSFSMPRCNTAILKLRRLTRISPIHCSVRSDSLTIRTPGRYADRAFFMHILPARPLRPAAARDGQPCRFPPEKAFSPSFRRIPNRRH